MSNENSVPSPLAEAAIARRSEALFKALTNDFLLREQFVTDPTQIFFEYVHSRKPSPEQTTVTNHLLWAVFATPRLLEWYRQYLISHQAKPPSSRQFMTDFVHAMVNCQAHDVVAAFVSSSDEGQAVLGFHQDFPVFDLKNGLIARGMKCPADNSVTPNTGPTTVATDTGTTKIATNTGPGSRYIFHGDEIWATPLNALVDYAATLRTSGALAVAWR